MLSLWILGMGKSKIDRTEYATRVCCTRIDMKLVQGK